MKKKLRDQLCNKYPVLYQAIYYPYVIVNIVLPNEGFYCGDGWYTLLDTFSSLVFERDPAAVIHEINKDDGDALRVRMLTYNVDEDHDYIYGLESMMAKISKISCEKCGKYVLPCTEYNPSGINKNKQYSNKIQLPLKLKNTGEMWYEMSRIFYETVSKCTEIYELPSVNFERIENNNGKLEIEISGGTEPFEAQLYFLLTYANKVDPDTGELVKL